MATEDDVIAHKARPSSPATESRSRCANRKLGGQAHPSLATLAAGE